MNARDNDILKPIARYHADDDGIPASKLLKVFSKDHPCRILKGDEYVGLIRCTKKIDVCQV
jgi:hypothetical protein